MHRSRKLRKLSGSSGLCLCWLCEDVKMGRCEDGMALGVQSWQVMGDIASRVDQKLGGLPEAQRGVGDLERHRKKWRKGILGYNSGEVPGAVQPHKEQAHDVTQREAVQCLAFVSNLGRKQLNANWQETSN